MHISAGDIAAVAAVASAIAAFFSAKIARSAEATARRQADASDKAAQAARDSARTADALAKIETSRRHEELAPRPVITWRREYDQGTLEEELVLVLTCTGPISYMVTGRQGHRALGGALELTHILGRVAGSGETLRIRLGSSDEDKCPDLVWLNFDPAEGEPCPCGEPQSEGSGHWRQVVSVPEMDNIDYVEVYEH